MPTTNEALRAYAEKIAPTIDATNARTRRRCVDRPDLQAMYATVLKMEKEVHAAGWDQNATVFLLHRNETNHRVRYERDAELTDMVLTSDPRPAVALMGLAIGMEELRAYAFSVSDDSARDPFTAQLMSRFPSFGEHLRADPGADFVPPLKPGWPFYGFGFVAESYASVGNLADLIRAAAEQAEPRRQDAVETRDLHVIGRDGYHWWVGRHRRVGDVALPRSCAVMTQDDADGRGTGTLPNALSRLTAACASNAVPVVPAELRVQIDQV